MQSLHQQGDTHVRTDAQIKFLYYPLQGDRSGLRKPKKDKNQQYSQLPPALIAAICAYLLKSVSADLTIKSDLLLTNRIVQDGVQRWSM